MGRRPGMGKQRIIGLGDSKNPVIIIHKKKVITSDENHTFLLCRQLLWKTWLQFQSLCDDFSVCLLIIIVAIYGVPFMIQTCCMFCFLFWCLGSREVFDSSLWKTSRSGWAGITIRAHGSQGSGFSSRGTSDGCWPLRLDLGSWPVHVSFQADWVWLTSNLGNS